MEEYRRAMRRVCGRKRRNQRNNGLDCVGTSFVDGMDGYSGRWGDITGLSRVGDT